MDRILKLFLTTIFFVGGTLQDRPLEIIEARAALRFMIVSSVSNVLDKNEDTCADLTNLNVYFKKALVTHAEILLSKGRYAISVSGHSEKYRSKCATKSGSILEKRNWISVGCGSDTEFHRLDINSLGKIGICEVKVFGIEERYTTETTPNEPQSTYKRYTTEATQNEPQWTNTSQSEPLRTTTTAVPETEPHCPPANCADIKCPSGIDEISDACGCSASRCSNPCELLGCSENQRCAIQISRSSQGAKRIELECREGVIPYFAQAPLSYMEMPTLSEAYLNFEIEIAFKPESMNGLLLYNGQKEDVGDFLSLSLIDGYVEFRFELGSGLAIIRSKDAVEIGKWHYVKASRVRKVGTLLVDGETEVTGTVPGKFLGLDLLEPMYIGAVPNFNAIPRTAGSFKGFVGCISLYKTGNVVHNLLKEAEPYSITTCETCAANPCLHGGICQEALSVTGYNCICPPGFSGLDCEKVGEGCYQGVCGESRCINRPGGGFDCYCKMGRTGLGCEKDIIIVEPSFSDDAYIAYPTPEALRTLKLNMKIKPRTTDDCLLAYCAQNNDGQGDFLSLAIRNHSLEFRFDTGSGPAIIHSSERILADEWVSVVAERNMQEGSLIVNDGVAAKGMSPGHTRGLNLDVPLYIGGVDKQRVTISQLAEVQHGFDGCVAHIEVNDVKVDLVNSVIDASNVEDCGGRLPCDKNPCHNLGTCVEDESASNGYVCECSEGYNGPNCETEVDLCSIIEPCKNGGTCIGSGNSYKCNCPLGYTGTDCADAAEFEDSVQFQGEGYLSLDQELLPHTATTVDEVVSFSFSTTAVQGLLLFHGQKPESNGKGQDYLAVAVVDGYLEFSYELGGGPAQIKSPAKVNDGKEHSVVLKRTGKHGVMELDGLHQQYGESQGLLQMLNTDGDIYLGGVPNHQLMTAGRFPQGLIGCLSDLQIQDSGTINLFTSAKSGANAQACEDEENSGEQFLEELEGGNNFVQK